MFEGNAFNDIGISRHKGVTSIRCKLIYIFYPNLRLHTFWSRHYLRGYYLKMATIR